MRPTEQIYYWVLGDQVLTIPMPSAASEVLPGILWGAFDEIGSPAYWFVQSSLHTHLGTYRDLRLGRSLSEELAACLLGGYGMPADLGLAAYSRLRERELIFPGVTADQLHRALSQPFTMSGRTRLYRFARQKARHLSQSLSLLPQIAIDLCDVQLRDALISLPGVGPKTASWIVRNYCESDAVAIIDVHILKAGRIIGLFAESQNPQQHYFDLERRFLDLASAMGVRAGLLDALVWDQMRKFSSSLLFKGRKATASARNHSSKHRNSARNQVAIAA